MGTTRLDVGHPGQLVPGLFHLVDVGHVGHRAAGVQIGEHHLLVVAGQDVGRLGHEVHTAEHDVLGFGTLLGQHRESKRVTPGIGPRHDLVTLVVMPENEQPVAQGRLGVADPARQLVGRCRCVPLGERTLHAQHVLGTSVRYGNSD